MNKYMCQDSTTHSILFDVGIDPHFQIRKKQDTLLKKSMRGVHALTKNIYTLLPTMVASAILFIACSVSSEGSSTVNLSDYTLIYLDMGVIQSMPSSTSPKWTGTPSTFSAGSGEIRYEISSRPEGATEGNVIIDSRTGVISATDDWTTSDQGEYTITATATKTYIGTRTSSIKIHEVTSNIQSLYKWYNDVRSNPNFFPTARGTAISTVEELKNIASSGEYYLANNIDITEEKWAALHSKKNPFTGTLYGNGYIIIGLTINAPDDNYQGLFAALDGATITNLGIIVNDIVANAVVGTLAGYAGKSMLSTIAVGPLDADSKVFADGVIIDGTAFGRVGGIVGLLESSLLSSGRNEGLAVQASDEGWGDGNASGTLRSQAGGLVGSNQGTAAAPSSATVHGFSSATVTAQSDTAGGLVGNNYFGIVRGSASGDVSSQRYVGGLVGANLGIGSTVIGSASGDVKGYWRVGGLVGTNEARGTVIGTATGDVTSASGGGIGGLVGYNSTGSTIGVSSGNVYNTSGLRVGGLVGSNGGELGAQANSHSPHIKLTGYSLGWVIIDSKNTSPAIGAVVGFNEPKVVNVYYNNLQDKTVIDRVGSRDKASTKINVKSPGATGTRGTNGIGIAVSGVDNATSVMNALTQGTKVGEWTFVKGEWPHLNLPDDIIDFMDYTTTPVAPDYFVD